MTLEARFEIVDDGGKFRLVDHAYPFGDPSFDMGSFDSRAEAESYRLDIIREMRH